MTITIETWMVTLLIAVVTAVIWATRLEARLDAKIARAEERHDDLTERVVDLEQTLGKFYVFKPPAP